MFIEYLSKDLRFFLSVIVTMVLSICLHELGHAFMAIWLGDRTPIEQHRITMNPVVHMGAMSLICLLLAGFSWGAMPVNPRRLRGKYGPALVAVAGPLVNVFLAVLALGGLGLWQRLGRGEHHNLSQVELNFRYLLWIFGSSNVMLTMFNLLPLPPLDGSRILANFSAPFAEAVQTYTSRG
ncbi:MAG: site-2 protease family protein [Planctomycetota bacterium]|nr:site-2 protease family protein [Planctomycetota bacterium]